MRNSHKVLAGCVVLAMSLSACGGGGGSAIPGGGANNALMSQGKTVPSAPMISVPQLSGALAYSDLGRRSLDAPVGVTVVLRYNNQAQLDAFVAVQSGPAAGTSSSRPRSSTPNSRQRYNKNKPSSAHYRLPG